MNIENPIRIASELSGMSESEIISKIGISDKLIRELDENPRSATMELIESLENVTGVTGAKLRPKKKIPGPVITPEYESGTLDFKNLIEEKRKSCEDLLAKYENRNDKEISAVLAEILDTYNNTAQNALDSVRKPIACAFGNSDTGKSTLINYFLGENVAKTSYSPLTSAVVYYEHSNDMPSYLKNEDGNNAFVFGEKNLKTKTTRKMFTHEDVKDSKKAGKYLISAGKFNEIIDEYSSRDGSNYKTKKYNVFEIVVYLDNEILKELTFVDIPGFGSGEENDNVGIAKKMYSVDILFYLSIANGFMRETDLANLQMMLKGRNSLKGVYILSTQADVIGSPKENEERLNSGFEILKKYLSDKQTKRFDLKELRECFYAFDTGNRKYCESLNKAIEEDVPAIIRDKIVQAKSLLGQVCDELNDHYKQEKIKILKSRNPEKKSKEAEELFIEERKKELRIYRAELRNYIEEFRKSSITEFEASYDEFMTEENLIGLMEKKKLKNKKEEIQQFSVYLSNEIGDKLSEIIGNKSETFSNKVNELLEKYEQSWNQGKKLNKLGIDFNGFDFKKAFATGLTGVGAYGALAIWATIVAGGSNLGGYILVAKVVSALSTIGISIGGTSTAMSIVSALGGPVTLGIALAAIAALAVFSIFSTNWKRRCAKDLIKSYEKQKCKENNKKQINQYWDDTIVAMNECMNSLGDRMLDYYHKINAVQDRINKDDQELYEAIDYIYYTICNVYLDLKFKLSVDKRRSGNDFFLFRKNEIEEELNKIKSKSSKCILDSNIHELEGVVFLDSGELQMFWRDMEDILNDRIYSAIALTDKTFLYRRKNQYSIYYKKNKQHISIRYMDAYPYLKENYEKYKDLIINTYVLKDDQIRYKVFDMLSMARKEILIMMPWINEYGWDSTGSYGKSMKQAFQSVLESNEKLNVKILVGYDLQHPDKRKERETVEKAKQITRDFSKYSDRFKIYTEIGTHEKIMTIDNTCSLAGSYNLLSNSAPYQEMSWAGESMNTFENPHNVERHRREILERVNLKWREFH